MAHTVLKKKSAIEKNTRCIVIILGQEDCEKTSRKIGKTVTLYHRERSKKRASLVAFSTQTGIQGLSTSRYI